MGPATDFRGHGGDSRRPGPFKATGPAQGSGSSTSVAPASFGSTCIFRAAGTSKAFESTQRTMSEESRAMALCSPTVSRVPCVTPHSTFIWTAVTALQQKEPRDRYVGLTQSRKPLLTHPRGFFVFDNSCVSVLSNSDADFFLLSF